MYATPRTIDGSEVEAKVSTDYIQHLKRAAVAYFGKFALGFI